MGGDLVGEGALLEDGLQPAVLGALLTGLAHSAKVGRVVGQ